MWHLVFIPIIIGVPCVLINFAVLKNEESTKIDAYACAVITTITAFVISAVFVTTLVNNPTALDVYRGNTELEITSVNGVPTDTVVVFKNK